jgi:uncharacterized protein with HEPN domain
MLNKYFDQLNKIIETCLIHQKRLEFAFSKIHVLFPLNEESFRSLGDEEMAYIDQYIFRFAKYQDLIGGKLIKQILLIEGENVDNLSFRDIFNKAEKIRIAENWEQWFELRQIRNEISHDYPVIIDEVINSLNKIITGLSYLEETYFRCISYLNSKNRIF